MSGRVHLVGVEGKPGSLFDLVEVHLEKKIGFNRLLFTSKIVLSTLIALVKGYECADDNVHKERGNLNPAGFQ